MSLKPDTLPSRGLSLKRSAVEEVGGCPVCRRFIFSDQEHVRAPLPLLGKVHVWCAGGGPR